MTPEMRHLLGGYATGTLTEAERQKLLAAALEDQELFDALAEEQPLKDLLDDPESRGYLLAELDQLKESAPQPARLMSKAHRAVPAAPARPVAIQPPPPPKPPARFWLPFAAVMLALLVTCWFWWRHEPEPAQQVAVNAPPAPTPAAAEPPRPPALPPRTADSEAPRRIDAASPAPEVRNEKALASAESAPKKEADSALVDAPKPAPAAPAAMAPTTAGAVAAPLYRLLRLENGQLVPSAANDSFRAGDTVVILLPAEPKPQLTRANGDPLPLEPDADGYRSAPISLSSGLQEFLVTPETSPARSRFAADRQAKAKAPSAAPLRIRLNVQ